MLLGDADRRESRSDGGSDGDVVYADDRKLPRNANMARAQPLEYAHGDQIVEANSGAGLARNQQVGRRIAARLRRCGGPDVYEGEREFTGGLGQSFAALCIGPRVFWAAQIGDFGGAQRDKVAHEAVRRGQKCALMRPSLASTKFRHYAPAAP